MKLSVKDILHGESIIGRIVLSHLSVTAGTTEKAVADDGVEVQILVNGVEVNVSDFMRRWENAVAKSIKEEGRELVREALQKIESFSYRIEKELIEQGLISREDEY